MHSHVTASNIDWNFILCKIQYTEGKSLPTYPGDLKTALLNLAKLMNYPKGEEAYQLASEIARVTTYSDPEIVYWFSRLVSLMND